MDSGQAVDLVRHTLILALTISAPMLVIGLVVGIVVSLLQAVTQSGKVDRGLVGVTYREVTPAMATSMKLPGPGGVLIEQVSPNSPAAAAGLKDQDVLVKVGDVDIKAGSDLPLAIIGHPAGEKVTVQYYRGGEKKSADVTLAPLNTR